jgi:cell division transport system permease protein
MRAKYVLSEVMVGLWRNVTMTIAMIITMAVSLTMLGASLVLYHQIDDMKQTFIGDLSVSVYLADGFEGAPEQQLQQQIAQDPLVIASSVQFISKDQAYQEFKEADSASSPELVKEANPQDLPASIRLKLKDQSTFAQFETEFNGRTGVEEVSNPSTILNKVFKVLDALKYLALVLAIAQGLAALLLVTNTIQVAAYSKRREVAVMKLVGASNWFIQAPFVVEAMFAGVIGAILAWLALLLSKIYLIDGSLKALTALLGPVEWSTIYYKLPELIVAGAVVSGITGWVTLRVYIKK